MTPASSNMEAQQRAAVNRLYHQVPAFVVIYGESKLGKTSDTLYSFPRALFIAARGALKPAANLVGWAPLATEEAEDIDGISAAINKHVRAGGQHDAVVVDDFSMAANNQRDKMERQGMTGWGLWQGLARKVKEVVKQCRGLGCHVVFTCHTRRPKDQTKGGPDVASENLSLALPKFADLVMRADNDMGRRPHPACYRCGIRSGPMWITGDRHHVCWDKTPMNTAEILRYAGYPVSWPPGMEWLERYVAHAVGMILQGHVENNVLTELGRFLFTSSIPEWQIAWAWRDTRDRVEITKAQMGRRLRSFGVFM